MPTHKVKRKIKSFAYFQHVDMMALCNYIVLLEALLLDPTLLGLDIIDQLSTDPTLSLFKSIGERFYIQNQQNKNSPSRKNIKARNILNNSIKDLERLPDNIKKLFKVAEKNKQNIDEEPKFKSKVGALLYIEHVVDDKTLKERLNKIIYNSGSGFFNESEIKDTLRNDIDNKYSALFDDKIFNSLLRILNLNTSSKAHKMIIPISAGSEIKTDKIKYVLDTLRSLDKFKDKKIQFEEKWVVIDSIHQHSYNLLREMGVKEYSGESFNSAQKATEEGAQWLKESIQHLRLPPYTLKNPPYTLKNPPYTLENKEEWPEILENEKEWLEILENEKEWLKILENDMKKQQNEKQPEDSKSNRIISRSNNNDELYPVVEFLYLAGMRLLVEEMTWDSEKLKNPLKNPTRFFLPERYITTYNQKDLLKEIDDKIKSLYEAFDKPVGTEIEDTEINAWDYFQALIDALNGSPLKMESSTDIIATIDLFTQRNKNILKLFFKDVRVNIILYMSTRQEFKENICSIKDLDECYKRYLKLIETSKQYQLSACITTLRECAREEDMEDNKVFHCYAGPSPDYLLNFTKVIYGKATSIHMCLPDSTDKQRRDSLGGTTTEGSDHSDGSSNDEQVKDTAPDSLDSTGTEHCILFFSSLKIKGSKNDDNDEEFILEETHVVTPN